jgi:DNA-binding MarR family transcriptional regulator
MQLSNHLEQELDISLAEQDLLNQLRKAGGEIRMSDLSRSLFLCRAGITRMVDRLEKAGWLTRVATPDDRRTVSAQLTSKGQDLVLSSRTLLADWVQTHFAAHLDASDLRNLGTSLRHLLEGLGRWEGQLAYLEGPGR